MPPFDVEGGHRGPSLFSRLTRLVGGDRAVPVWEWGSAIAMMLTAAVTYWVLTGQDTGKVPLSPVVMAVLLVANLLPATAILVLAGRRMALRRAARSSIGSKGRLHVRLVALFSLIAAVPTLLVVIFASILFQSGVQFWFSDPARGMIENAVSLSKGYYAEKLNDVRDETLTMASDLRTVLRQTSLQSTAFQDAYIVQTIGRKFNQTVIVQIGADGKQRTAAVAGSEGETSGDPQWLSPTILRSLRSGEPVVVQADADKIESATAIFPETGLYLYAVRAVNSAGFAMGDRAQEVLNDYRALAERSRRLQLQFNAALFLISLLIIGVAVWVALLVADRLVYPVSELVHAAQNVANGKLSTRVPIVDDQPDEIGILRRSFNQMTERLEGQTGDLLTANSQLDARRAFIETVLESVTAGIVSLGDDGCIRLANSIAQQLLGGEGEDLIGRPLRDVSPAMADLVAGGEQRAVIQFGGGDDARTLAVNLSVRPGAKVLTFEDITQQLVDQRRAAWADVARRIAHEIKNPLTPIQLAAERLKRKFGKDIAQDGDVFVELTGTIIRQVGDLRNIVDEFSAFARMPKPVFRRESLQDMVKQSLLLHEVAHPAIAFDLEAPGHDVELVCDRRQIGQALTNIIKNAVEAIDERARIDKHFDLSQGEVGVRIFEQGEQIHVEIGDNGIGLPEDRERIIEPYVTTRASGTGLGLAIVKKIVEEHFGEIEFVDSAQGGTCVILHFFPALLGNPGGGKLSDHQDGPKDQN
ncbi:ATP-binding protein [Novosphingopyxis sp.]|uniref:sensor histidine kinase n=1 Tax=Novosphingopyxis sp. TaxID=2709690 RepID=UPI003B5BD1CF